MTLFTLLIIIHALCWAAWFGAGLNAPRDIIHTLPMDHPHRDELLGRLKTLMAIWIFGANGTLWSGVLLALCRFGWQEIPPGIYLKLGLTLGTFVVGICFLKPALKGFMHALAAREGAEQLDCAGLKLRRLIWLEKSIIVAVVLLTMVGKALFDGPSLS